MRFWTGDIETKGGFTGKFLMGGLYDGKRYRSFDKEDDFMKFLLNIKGTVFFHYLDFDSRTILEWCLKHKVRIESMPRLSGDQKVIIWHIGDLILRDSFILTQSSLRDLAESFNLKTRKLPMEDYHFSKRTRKLRRYLRNDVIALYGAMRAFYRFVGRKNFNKTTIASIAMEKFKEIDRSAYDRIKEFPVYKEMDKFFRTAYFSGYYADFDTNIKDMDNIFKLDVNSYYALPMLTKSFPWGNAQNVDDQGEINKLISEGELGIVKCRAKVPKGLKLGFLPSHSKEGVVYRTQGIIRGAWTTPEIKYAQKLGYSFIYEQGVFWEFQDRLFRKYVNYLGRIKERSRGSKRVIAKQLLVGFYGKFGQGRDVSFLKYYKDHPAGKYYLDAKETIADERKYIRMPYSAPQISIFTTAYARIYMYDFCNEVGWENVFSIIADAVILKVRTTSAFRKKWIHPRKIGKFKIQAKVDNAIILGRGVYAIRDSEGKEFIKNQGGLKEYNKLLTFSDFEKVKSKQKKIWIQYKKMKRPATIYSYLKGRSELKGEETVSRKVHIKSG